MNKIVKETEQLLAMRICEKCGKETPLYIARIANSKGEVIGTDSMAPRCDTCGADGWEYNPVVVKYPLGRMNYANKKRSGKSVSDL